MSAGAFDVDVRDLLWRKRSRYEDDLAAVPAGRAPMSMPGAAPVGSAMTDAAGQRAGWMALLDTIFARCQPTEEPSLRRGQLAPSGDGGEPARRFVAATWIEAASSEVGGAAVEHQLVWFTSGAAAEGAGLDEDLTDRLPVDWPLTLARSLAGAATTGRIEPGAPADPGRWTDVGEIARRAAPTPLPSFWRDWRVMAPLLLLVLSILFAFLSRRRG